MFKNLFGSNSDTNNLENKINWIELKEESQLTNLISNSTKKPALIFKHSTRCGVSRMALKSFEKEYDIDESAVDVFFLDLLSFRNISNKISDDLNIQHQSPQVLVLKSENVIYSDSHYSISVKTIKEVLNAK